MTTDRRPTCPLHGRQLARLDGAWVCFRCIVEARAVLVTTNERK